MMIEVLSDMRKKLKDSDLSTQDRRLWWTVACWAFCGSFRIIELIADTEKTFDPTMALMNSDIKLTKVEVDGSMTELLIIKLKNTKKSRGASIFSICRDVRRQLFMVPSQRLQKLAERVQD